METMTQHEWSTMIKSLQSYQTWCEINAPHLFGLIGALGELLDQLPNDVDEAYEVE